MRVSSELKIRFNHNFFTDFEKHLKQVEASKNQFKQTLKKKEWEDWRKLRDRSKAATKDPKVEQQIMERLDIIEEEPAPHVKMQLMLEKRKEFAHLSDAEYSVVPVIRDPHLSSPNSREEIRRRSTP
jgi:hypothetical protein